MAWKQILKTGQTESDDIPTATPFMIRVEGPGASNAVLRLQSKRDDEGAEWDEGEILPKGTMIPSFGCLSTIYRVVSNVDTVNIFYVDVLTSQTDRKSS